MQTKRWAVAIPDPADPEVHRVLTGASHVRVLEMLCECGGTETVADLARKVDPHPNTVRLHLDQLVTAAW